MKKIGIYNPYLETKGGGEKLCLSLASVLAQDKNNVVELITNSIVDLKSLEKYFQIDLSRVKLHVINVDSPITKILFRLRLPARLRNYIGDWVISRNIKKSGFDIFINNCYFSNLPNPTKIGVYLCMFPQKLEEPNTSSIVKRTYVSFMNILYRLTLHPGKANAIESYQHILSISEFTQKYVKKYWGRESQILYPVCEDMYDRKLAKKKNIILNVGRFFENDGGNHHKRQDFLLDAFVKMEGLHESGWELHFAGSVAENIGALKYLLHLINRAQGYPVYFHFNSTFDNLKILFNEASIYWHATGYGSDKNKHPERQEHFGITTVEAMSTGAVPVVINTAGQKEMVTDGETGYLWNNGTELIDKTLSAIHDIKKMNGKISRSAKTQAKQFNIESFSDSVKEIFKSIY